MRRRAGAAAGTRRSRRCRTPATRRRCRRPFRPAGRRRNGTPRRGRPRGRPADAMPRPTTRSSSSGLLNACAVADATPLWISTNQTDDREAHEDGHDDPRPEELREGRGDALGHLRVGDEHLPAQRKERVELLRRVRLRAREQPLVPQLLDERRDVLLVEAALQALGHRGGKRGDVAASRRPPPAARTSSAAAAPSGRRGDARAPRRPCSRIRRPRREGRRPPPARRRAEGP